MMFNFDKLYEESTDDDVSAATSTRQALPLKQRTSSIDVRKDFSTETWMSLLHLISPKEFFVTVNNFAIFRRHISWAISDGGDLRNYITQRYASNMVFMSLLLGAELGVLFNSDHVMTNVRDSMAASAHHELKFWIGLSVLMSIVFTILSLFTTFTAWGMVSAISDENAHCMLRSSIGQYVVELPQRFIVMSIYSFLWIFVLFLSLLLPALEFWSVSLTVLVAGLFFHVVTVFSAFGRLILHTGAIAHTRIFDERYEQSLFPQSLHSNLIKRARAELTNKTSVVRQYRRKCEPIDRDMSQEDMIRRLRGAQPLFSGSVAASSRQQTKWRPSPVSASHKRAGSTVRFSDQLFGNQASVTGNGPDTTARLKTSSMKGDQDVMEEEVGYHTMEEGLSSGSSSQTDEQEYSLSRDKEKNWFANIASSIHETPIAAFADAPDYHNEMPPPEPRPKKNTHHRVDSKVRFARDSIIDTTAVFDAGSAPIEVATSKPPSEPVLDGVLKASSFTSEDGSSIGRPPAAPPPQAPSYPYTHAAALTTSRDDQRNWFSSIASAVDSPLPPRHNSHSRNNQGMLASSSSGAVGMVDEEQNLLGATPRGHYSSV